MMSTKHTLIQERLNAKRTPLDEWNTHEQLCLASAVVSSGDQNWMSVSRALKACVTNFSSRPIDWFLAKPCATQYGKLLDCVDTPKRKKRTASERDQPVETPSTPVESLVKKLTTERIIELQSSITEDQAEYAKLKADILFLQSSAMDEARIREMWSQIEQEKVDKELEKERYDQWLEERAEKKLQMERQWRRNYGMKAPIDVDIQKTPSDEAAVDPAQQQAGTSSTTPSPLLTSLLKSSQANQTPIPTSNTARSAPTITNLLTGSSSTSSNSPTLITQSSTNAQIINASVNVGSFVPNAVINHSASSVQIPVSQSAPTLITLLDKKLPLVGSTSQDSSMNEKQQMMMSISVPETSGGKDDGKDEEADILADFNELISEKFDDEYLEDLTSIIMKTENFDGKMREDEAIKDVDDSSQATSTDDYDKLKIKQLVEDFAGIPVPEPLQTSEGMVQDAAILPTDNVSAIMQTQSEPETSNPPSMDIGPTESNDSKEESAADDKVMIISDESSNTNDEKKELMEKLEAGDGEESQSVKSSVPDDVKDASGEDSNKEARAFQGLQESDENSAGSEKDGTKTETVFRVDDSDEDTAFEDAKEHQEDAKMKVEKGEELPKKAENIPELNETQTSSAKASVSEVEEVSRSAGSIDSDDEVLEVKVSRNTGRKKALENIKSETPKTSTRSRDHSENDDTRDSPLIRTRSRRSSAAPVVSKEDAKPSFNFPKEQDHSMWKGRWDDCHKEIQKLKDFSSVVDNKLFQEDSYKSVVMRPMNMKLITKNIENHVSTMPTDIKRDFALMCTNVMMDSRKGSKFYETIQHFMEEGMKIIDSHMEVGDAYKSYRKQIKKKN